MNGKPKYQSGFKIPVIAIVFIIVSIFLAAIYFKGESELITKKNNYTETNAIVIDHTYKNGKAVSVVLQYNVDDGIYQVTSNSSYDSSKANGAIVKIKYNPDNPTDIVFADAHENVLLIISSVVLFTIGITIVIISFVKLAKHSKRKVAVLEGVPTYKTAESDINNTVNDNPTPVPQQMGLNDVVNNTHSTDNMQYTNNQNASYMNNESISNQNAMPSVIPNESQINVQSSLIDNNEANEQIADVITNYEPLNNEDEKLRELEIDSNLSDNDIIEMVNIINSNNNVSSKDEVVVEVPNSDTYQPIIEENIIPEPISETQRLRSKLELLKNKNNINTDSYTTPSFMSRNNEDNV